MNTSFSAVPYQTFDVMQAGARPAVAGPKPVPLAADHLQPLRQQLLPLLPKASRVSFVGEVPDEMIRAYSRSHQPDSCARTARGDASAETIGACDLLILANGLGNLDQAGDLLQRLAANSPAAAQLFICELVPTQGIDSLFALLANTGWMPHLLRPDQSERDLAGGAASCLIHATKPFAAVAEGRDIVRACFSVIVASPSQIEQTPAAVTSPGLAEVNAHISIGTDAGSAAQALAKAAAIDETDSEWILLCNEDAYFPAGFGSQLNALLAGIPQDEQPGSLIGFIGIGVDVSNQSFAPAGFVIEALRREDYPETRTAVSIDELALVIPRRSVHRIDPAMGWQLWATDLCMASICEHKVFPRIVRLPLLNRSSKHIAQPAALLDSAALLLDKFADFGPIPTLSGMIDAQFVASLAAQAMPASDSSAAGKAAAAAIEADRAAPVAQPDPVPVRASAGGSNRRPVNQCSICGSEVANWLPHPHPERVSEFMKLLDVVGSDLSVYQCPSCGSNDRDRHVWHYLSAIGVPQRLRQLRVLHIAPERALEQLIQAARPAAYVRGDLHPRHANHLPLNVEDLAFADDSFDLIICNHVLEHVADPSKALGEFHRCLAAGGLLVAQTPYSPVLRHTMELNRPVSEAFATVFYGQDDHVRLFGADIVDHFHRAGFSGNLLAHHEVLGEMDARAQGCNALEPFFAFSK